MSVRQSAWILALALASNGCGLLVDADFPLMTDAASIDSPDERPGEDTQPDVTRDAPVDRAPDVTLDVPTDRPADTAVDAGLDAGPDVPPDRPMDSAIDVAIDVAVDAGVDVLRDVVDADVRPDVARDVVVDNGAVDVRDATIDLGMDVGAPGCSISRPCPGGESCDLGDNCASGAVGVCVTVSTPCPIDLIPNCGCDGRTYASDCARVRANVGRRGPFSCAMQDAGPRICRDNTECGADDYCDAPLCRGDGRCVPRGAAVCVAVPVCGCGGRTYGDACEAARDGERVDLSGEACRRDAGRTCGSDRDCPTSFQCCTRTGLCFNPACLSCCMPGAAVDAGAGGG